MTQLQEGKGLCKSKWLYFRLEEKFAVKVCSAGPYQFSGLGSNPSVAKTNALIELQLMHLKIQLTSWKVKLGMENKNEYLSDDLIIDEVIAFDFNNSFYLVLKEDENTFGIYKWNSRFESNNYTAYNDSLLIDDTNTNEIICNDITLFEGTEEDVMYEITKK